MAVRDPPMRPDQFLSLSGSFLPASLLLAGLAASIRSCTTPWIFTIVKWKSLSCAWWPSGGLAGEQEMGV